MDMGYALLQNNIMSFEFDGGEYNSDISSNTLGWLSSMNQTFTLHNKPMTENILWLAILSTCANLHQNPTLLS